MHKDELLSVRFTIYYSSDQIKQNDIGGECSTHGEAEKYIQNFGRNVKGNRSL
jgi:hypothetical protein